MTFGRTSRIVVASLIIPAIYFGIGIFLYNIAHVPMKPVVIDSESIHDIVRPSVVRVSNHVTGEVKVPAFDLDLRTMTVWLTEQEPLTEELDEQMLGSGFVVNSEGYVVTNSHVVSGKILQETIVRSIFAYGLFSRYLDLSESEAAEVDGREKEVVTFVKKAAEYVLKHSSLTAKNEVVVFNPESRHDSLDEYVKDGFQAEVVSVNENFLNDERDVAILKIDKQSVKALSLGSTQGLSSGKSVKVMGFPGNADVGQQTFLEPTFTSGSVSAIKDSINGLFQIIQTDAKISAGSSGGPMLDENGEVVGVSTFQISSLEEGGDAFAFAIPGDLVKKVLADNEVVYNQPDSYYELVRNGLFLQQNNRCGAATQELLRAAQTNESFGALEYVEPYIDRCQEIVAEGKSIDNRWDEAVVWIKTGNNQVWWIGAVALLLMGAGAFVIFRLLRVVHKEEVEISRLERYVHGQSSEPAAAPVLSVSEIQTPFSQAPAQSSAETGQSEIPPSSQTPA